MLPTTPTAIFNMALGLLVQKPISDIVTDPQSSIEALGHLWYDTVRRSLLMSYTPNFAVSGESISRAGTPTLTTYPDYYAFPNTYLKLIAISDPRTSLQNYDYLISEKNILIDNSGESTLNVWFVKDVIDISKYPANFIRLLAGELAVTVGPSVTTKPSIMQAAESFRSRAKMEVLAANGQERPPIRVQKSRIVNAGLFPRSGTQIAGPHSFDFDPN